MFGTVYTGFGYWDVSAWIVFFAIAAGLTLWLRAQGREDFKEGTDQDEIYWSGNPVPDDGAEISVPASSAYWGFRKAMEPFYKVLTGMHTGIATDIVGFYVLTVAFMAVFILL
ncbi:MAG TPA: hydrogenase [Aminobacteriaceae bacterium]|nr:hydrogenase [Aminobacteriaceae bacterium]